MRQLAALAAICALAVLPAVPTIAGEESITLPDALGRELTMSRCITCHSLDYLQANAPVLDRAGWEKTVRKMIDRYGAPIDAADVQGIVDYLSAAYPHGS